ncbi:GTP-binding protein [Methanosarcina sp. KYL-1]|uniref:CobW family GTP-binding protein n=1 Tax=Methanosarcina sp. KYL-1 TaxID=2602068 RepID=UPI002101A86B|nr:GTP-binding protein [Methanosarcina sp. KYL-1]MCQ1536027.1 GTP-binding protein [Methanosarcina sp. KYL-1]
MRIAIIGGFLGSGKTTTILNLGKYLSEQGKKVAIIVNEIGEIGLDGDTLSMAGITTKELTSGCICCTLKISMRITLMTLAEEYEPDVVLIEPTGIAFPKQIRDDISSLEISPLSFAPVVTVVDPSRFELGQQEIPRFMEIQVSEAEVLCINKTDAVSIGKVLSAEKALKELNPEARILKFSAKHEGKLETLLQELEIEGREREGREREGREREGREREGREREGREREGREREKTEEQNSIEISEVASYSLKLDILSELDSKKAVQVAEAVLESVRSKVARINPDFIGHIKVSLKTKDGGVKGSVTSASESPQLEILPERGGMPAKLKLLSGVTKVPHAALMDIVETSVAEELERAELDFKKMKLLGHSLRSGGNS